MRAVHDDEAVADLMGVNRRLSKSVPLPSVAL